MKIFTTGDICANKFEEKAQQVLDETRRYLRNNGLSGEHVQIKQSLNEGHRAIFSAIVLA